MKNKLFGALLVLFMIGTVTMVGPSPASAAQGGGCTVTAGASAGVAVTVNPPSAAVATGTQFGCGYVSHSLVGIVAYTCSTTCNFSIDGSPVVCTLPCSSAAFLVPAHTVVRVSLTTGTATLTDICPSPPHGMEL